MGHLGEEWLAGSVAERRDAHQRGDALIEHGLLMS
jgi:hypothetical protein